MSLKTDFVLSRLSVARGREALHHWKGIGAVFVRHLAKRGRMIQSTEILRRVSVLTILGGAGFWVANFAISLTPIAAEYRTALSIAYRPMLVEALFGGLFIAFGVSYILLRFFDRIPTKDPITKSTVLSLVALFLVTLLVAVPATAFATTGDSLHYFLIGIAFNAIRILALGMVIGLLYKKTDRGMEI